MALEYDIERPPDGFPSWKEYWRDRGLPEEELREMGDGSDRLVDPEGAGPPFWFQPVPQTKVVKNRLHLDLNASGGRNVPLETRKKRVGARVKDLRRAGAKKLRVLEMEGLDHYAVVMEDPEGNEFCVN